MIGEYNISFLIASLLLLVLVLYHFRKQKKLENVNTKVFQLFLLTGIVDVLLDLLSTYLIVENVGSLAEFTRFTLTVFYLIQVLFPYFVVYYTQSLRNTKTEIIRRDAWLWAIPPVFMCVMIVLNYWGEFLFGFDNTGSYYKGDAYMLMYGYALLYVLVALLICVVYFKELGSANVKVVVEFVLLETVCSCIQAATGAYLLTGFGIGVGMLVLYIVIHNPNVYIDTTTGTFDKHFFMTWMQEQLDHKRSIHVFMVYVVNLQDINKVFGTRFGDSLLGSVADKLQQLNPEARVFRVSGKRFLLATGSLAKYENCRTSLLKFFQERFSVGEEKIKLTVVLSGMVNCEKIEGVDTLLAYLEYMSELCPHSEAVNLIQSDDKIMSGFLYEQEVERFLDTAIEKDLFEVYYQPVYSIETGQFVTLEALSRLKHPTLGYVPPDVFIMLAEKNGKILQVGELQFKRICRFLSEHREIMEGIHNVKVNLSPYELLKYGHCKMLTDTIRSHGLPFSWFQFEITETVATEYSETLLKAVDDFLKAGIGLCLDDFGSGYANMNTVMNLPFSEIKLDRSLLKDVTRQGAAATFYQSIAGVFHNLGYKIVAEGVETEDEVKLLRNWNVDMIQGFYFSKPLNETELLRLLKRERDRI